MLQVDLEKAFDRVSHEILFSVLDHVNVGAVLCQFVRMVYQNRSTRLVVNKHVTERISLFSSVRQRCPLSPLLFCIFLEPFCLSIIRSSYIRGFKLQSGEVRILSYADDAAIFCIHKDSVKRAVESTETFCQHPCSSFNSEKCIGFGTVIGFPRRLCLSVLYGPTPRLVILGYLGITTAIMMSTGVVTLTLCAQRRTSWGEGGGGSGLSTFARASVCNAFLAEKVWYVLQVLHCSRVNIQRIHRVFPVFYLKLGFGANEQNKPFSSRYGWGSRPFSFVCQTTFQQIYFSTRPEISIFTHGY